MFGSTCTSATCAALYKQKDELLPDDGDKLSHGEFMRHQKLGLIQRRQILFPLVPLDDDLRGAGGQVRT